MTDLKTVRDAIEFASKLVMNKSDGAESFMISMHYLKKGKIEHTFSYEGFKNGDWGPCLIAMGVEARKAELNAQTAVSQL